MLSQPLCNGTYHIRSHSNGRRGNRRGSVIHADDVTDCGRSHGRQDRHRRQDGYRKYCRRRLGGHQPEVISGQKMGGIAPDQWQVIERRSPEVVASWCPVHRLLGGIKYGGAVSIVKTSFFFFVVVGVVVVDARRRFPFPVDGVGHGYCGFRHLGHCTQLFALELGRCHVTISTLPIGSPVQPITTLLPQHFSIPL